MLNEYGKINAVPLGLSTPLVVSKVSVSACATRDTEADRIARRKYWFRMRSPLGMCCCDGRASRRTASGPKFCTVLRTELHKDYSQQKNFFEADRWSVRPVDCQR